jgi:hypothetical protein
MDHTLKNTPSAGGAWMTEWMGVLEKVIAGGPAMIFGWLWWLERTDRISKDLKLEQLTERMLVLVTELKGMMTGKKSG